MFESMEDGSGCKILLRIGDYFKTETVVSITDSNVFLAVNGSGIYLYQHDKGLHVAWFTLEGELKKEMSISGNISQVYVAENRMYFAKAKTSAKQQICYFDCETKALTPVMEVSKTLELYGNVDIIVFKVAFEKVRAERSLYDEGWYLYRVATKELVCLSSGNCPPHFVVEKPDAYLEGSSQYIPFKDKLTIRAVDLVRNMMWVATPLKEKLQGGVSSQEYWEPMVLEQEGAPILDVPIWRMTNLQFTSGAKTQQIVGASYFDGSCFLNGRALYYIKSFGIDGSVVNYGEDKERGACQHFRVLNSHIYVDLEGTGWEQHKIEDGKLTFVRLCQFGGGQEVHDEIRMLVKKYQPFV